MTDPLDTLLDAALRERHSAEVPQEFAARTLRFVAAGTSVRRRRLPWLLPAGALAALLVAALLVAALTLLHLHHAAHPQQIAASRTLPREAQQSVSLQPQGAGAAATPAREVPERRTAAWLATRTPPLHVRTSQAATRPQPAQFPTPAPLSAEEEALARLARSHAALPAPVPEVRIAQLQISALPRIASLNKENPE